MGCRVQLNGDVAEIWVSNGTPDADLQGWIDRCSGYQVVVYRSGKESLQMLTEGLLSHNGVLGG